MTLESKDLTVRFGSKVAVDKMSLHMEAGQVVGMLGPNGSGKTTWMKAAAGLLKPTSGVVMMDDEPVGIQTRASIAYLSTEPYFYSWMSIEAAGKYYADFFNDFSMERYHELLNEMELDPKLKIRSLSSGMTAKMKIAVTMARDARVYMLDEPFNGIDLLARDAIRKCILRSATADKLLLISSHMVEELEAVVNRAVFISDGHLLEDRMLSEMNEAGEKLVDRYRTVFGHGEEFAK